MLIAACCFAAFILLGLGVHRYGEPPAIWAFDRAILGHGAIVAWWVTQICRAYVLVPLAAILVVAAIVVPRWRARIIFSLVMLLLAWRIADFFQHLFARPRRLDWVIYHERSFSYPSSHAAIAVAFFALWAWLLWADAASRSRRAAAALVGALALALCWSRLALGAHYATDVAGGALLGAALLGAGAAVWPGITGEARKERA